MGIESAKIRRRLVAGLTTPEQEISIMTRALPPSLKSERDRKKYFGDAGFLRTASVVNKVLQKIRSPGSKSGLRCGDRRRSMREGGGINSRGIILMIAADSYGIVGFAMFFENLSFIF